MTLLLTSGSNHTIHIFVEHTAPHRRGGANQNDHRPHPTGGVEGTRHVTMTLLLTSGSNHTIRLPPTGGAGPTKKTTGPTPQGGGRGRGQTRPDPESNKAKQDNYPLDRQGRIPWGGGGEGGVWQPCIIYTHTHMFTHICRSSKQGGLATAQSALAMWEGMLMYIHAHIHMYFQIHMFMRTHKFLCNS